MAISVSNNYINNPGGNAASLSDYSDTGKSSQRQNLDINNAKSGQTLQGEILSKDGKNVTLRLSNGQTVNAKLSQDVPINLGKMISFEIKKDNQGTIALRPLFSNLSGSSTVSSALRAAGLATTVTNINMTSAMMDLGMGIDRNSLLNMARDVNAYPLNDPVSIVQMAKLGLPIDELNITQYENYKNFEHQIIDSVNNLANGLTEAAEHIFNEGNAGDFAKLSGMLKEINTKLVSGAFVEEATDSVEENAIMEESIVKPKGFAAIKNAADSFLDAIKNAANRGGEPVLNDINASEVKATENISLNDSNEMPNVDRPDIDVRNASDVLLEELDNKEDQNKEPVKALDNQQILSDLSKKIGMPLNEEPDNAKIMDIIKFSTRVVSDNRIPMQLRLSIKDELSELFKSNDIKKLFTDAVKSQLTLSPDKMGKDNDLGELYSRILKFSQKASDFASGNNMMQQISQSAGAISDNVNFMNQLNQFVSYIQLPLKLNNEDAHGELYVYSKHKSLSETDGNITALIHLDMENLGPMDVHIAMKDYTNVSTNFRLESEKVIDFLAENIHILNDALTAKGYQVSSSVTNTKTITGEDKPMTDEFFKESPDKEGMKLLSKLQFDVRA